LDGNKTGANDSIQDSSKETNNVNQLLENQEV